MPNSKAPVIVHVRVRIADRVADLVPIGVWICAQVWMRVREKVRVGTRVQIPVQVGVWVWVEVDVKVKVKVAVQI